MGTVKILATADWHIGSYKGPEKDGINLRSQDTKNCLEFMVERAEQERPELVLVSGDIFNTGKTWSDRCCDEVITAIDIITRLSNATGQVIIMRGTPNHDGSAQFNVLAVHFADIANVFIVVTPEVIHTEYADIAVLPGFDRGEYRAKFPGYSKEEENEIFTNELGNIVMGLKGQCRTDRQAILMSHYTVPGCNMESGQTQFLTQFEPIITQEMLLAANYDLVALGHIHRPQKLENIKNCFYSGAINAMNFNDEGQERGFWIHKTTSLGVWASEFHNTPIREFITFTFTDTDITAINCGNIDEVAMNYWRYNGAVIGKIVRIHYSCSAENNKALNKAILEKTLLDDGAFMVWEILPDKIDEFTNRTELANTMDPETNLRRYLEEKQYLPEKIQELILKARPVMAAAEASMTTAANTGIFVPVEIEVKNYRNYEEENFNFEDIRFCTINGQNGAGKSSLFMDAIIDCLYEEPREGEKTGWIRNDEKARSGSIMFTFRIGKKTFRVTRTRARSGKGTLNIAEFVDGEWKDCSKEKYNDTQQEILNIVGMDSLTFKSCALIMQDQYGLFLQAKPEERVEVLGTLLGLGVYQIMEKVACDKAKVFGVKNRELRQKVEIHTSTIANFGTPDEELAVCKTELAWHESSLREKISERDRNRLLLANQQEAADRRTKLLEAVSTLQVKKSTTKQNRVTQQAIIDSSSIILDSRPEIEAKVAEHSSLVEKERILASESTLYSSKKKEAEDLERRVVAEQNSIDGMNLEATQKETELLALQPTDQDEVIRNNAAEYEQQKNLLDEAYEKERAYREVEQKLATARYGRDTIISQCEAVINGMKQEEESLQKKAELLDNVECVDIENAKCGFLEDAVSAKKRLAEYPKMYKERKQTLIMQTEPYNEEIETLERQLEEKQYDADLIAEISKRITELQPYVSQLEVLNQRESRIALIKTNLDNLRSNIREARERLAMVKLKASTIELERDRYAKSFEEHVLIQEDILTLKPWLEKEKQLPVAEERNSTAKNRIIELKAELTNIDAEISEKQAEADKEIMAISGMEELTGIVAKMDDEVDVIDALVKEKQMEIGALRQKSEQIAELKQEIITLQKQQNEYAKKAADYDTLKVAFSRSGVPHQIIRSIIPKLTATSNSILGQMTGGKMGVEFRLERLQKNGKEKGSLDIFIEEYGKAVLPYLSKSGGEKVKSSLSVILALAEIKSSSAGIQLGMLFIDEAPFLDGDGTQAYVDALEAIQNRYSNTKVMAITHDIAFKERFPQSITVFKDEHGSHIRWD